MTHSEGMALRFAAGTDPGRERDHNEDSAYASPRLLVVADGMGGHAHGEVASAVAVASMADLDVELAEADLAEVDLLAELSAAVDQAGKRLRELFERDPDLEGMGTTLVGLFWDGSRFGLVHIGDSRIYRLRAGELAQLTRDHTLVQSLVDEGRLTEAEAAEHPRRSMLMRALQGTSTVEPDVSLCEVASGDRYLLCSDGLTDVVGPRAIQEVLAAVPEPQTAVNRLIRLANRGGGPDNITCVVVDVVDGPVEQDPEPVVLGAAAEVDLDQAATDAVPPGWLPRWMRRLVHG